MLNNELFGIRSVQTSTSPAARLLSIRLPEEAVLRLQRRKLRLKLDLVSMLPLVNCSQLSSGHLLTYLSWPSFSSSVFILSISLFVIYIFNQRFHYIDFSFNIPYEIKIEFRFHTQNKVIFKCKIHLNNQKRRLHYFYE